MNPYHYRFTFLAAVLAKILHTLMALQSGLIHIKINLDTYSRYEQICGK